MALRRCWRCGGLRAFACAARLLTAAWATIEMIVCELEVQVKQNKMLLVMLYAEGIEELSFGCYCGAGQVARVAARVGSGRSWIGERGDRDIAHVKGVYAHGTCWNLQGWAHRC